MNYLKTLINQVKSTKERLSAPKYLELWKKKCPNFFFYNYKNVGPDFIIHNSEFQEFETIRTLFVQI